MTATDALGRTASWVEVCPLRSLTPDRGIAALVDGEQVALFLLDACGDDGDGRVFAIDHVDPFHGVGVLARGLVGSVADRPTVASPLHKQRFDLRTGECLDDPAVSVRVWDVEVVDGAVRVRAR